ncbi:MAG: preprotein translocase subunit YajC [Methylacidiphilales bacterium]|nr:preprotein translocase subunit YajC [Candidatus Methylacidiphilales bacterium]
MIFDSTAVFFAQATNAANAAAADNSNAQAGPPGWTNFIFFALVFIIVYFALIRPQVQARKKQEETIKTAKTGDRIVTTSGIHGVISNVKDSTVIVKVADNVKLEIEKTHIEKITRADSSGSESDKTPIAKAS